MNSSMLQCSIIHKFVQCNIFVPMHKFIPIYTLIPVGIPRPLVHNCLNSFTNTTTTP
jgi:hypothetical protein